MIRRIDVRGRTPESLLGDRSLLPRAEFDVDAASAAVRPLVDDVRHRGHDALVEQAERFDGVAVDRVRVPQEAIAAGLRTLDDDVRRSLEAAIDRLRRTCRAEMPSDVTTGVGLGRVTQRNVPVGRVGLYVPGAQAPLVSSVMMNAVPAQVAGVGSVALASPAQKEYGGLPHPTILAACALLGIDEVYAAGGAGAVAMFAFGYDHADGGCRPVDVITGPANIYGVAAKRLVAGLVGIDSEAGPTEIAILADSSADPRYVAADLISQAEHDPMAAAVLVTDSQDLVAAVEAELDRQVALTKHHERVTAALGGEQSGVVVVDDLDVGQTLLDSYAAEHLEIHTADAQRRAGAIRNAGAIFVGPYAPVSLGDYAAGSNHVLPTAGCACHSSGLSVRAFLKTVQVVEYSRAALESVAGDVLHLSGAEDLPGHGDAVRVRLED